MTSSRYILLGLLALALLYGRALWSARGLLQEGQAALAAGRPEEAVRTLGQAARLWAPGNGAATAALDGLEQIAARDPALAQRAYQEVRASLLGARHLGTPRPEQLRRVNGRLAALLAAQEGGGPAHEEAARRWHLQALERNEAPGAAGSLLAVLGAALFIGAAVGFLQRGLTPAGALVRPAAARYGAGVLAGLLLLLGGLWAAGP